MLENTIEFRVRYAETDQMKVAHHTSYLVWCEMGRTALMRQLGVSYAELERQGVFLAVSEARISFRASARYDDPIRVRTWLARMRSRGVTFAYVVEPADGSGVLAEAETDHICIDAEGTPRKLPSDVEELLRRALASEQGPVDALYGV